VALGVGLSAAGAWAREIRVVFDVHLTFKPTSSHDAAPNGASFVRQAGSTFIRINVLWSKYADGGAASVAYRQGLRNAVHCAIASGLTPYMTITSAFYDSPTPHVLNPSPTQFASLVTSVVAEFYPLGVQRYSMWNEPNLGQFLSAGVCGGTPKDTSSLYRNLYTAGYNAARAASGQHAIIYLGELSEITRSVKPVACGANSKRAQSTITIPAGCREHHAASRRSRRCLARLSAPISTSYRLTRYRHLRHRTLPNGADRHVPERTAHEAYADLAGVAAAIADDGGRDFDTGMLGKTSNLAMSQSRPYGEGPNPSWSNPQSRKAFCRVRQWSIDNAKGALALPSGC
jgi:hypothetical protein